MIKSKRQNNINFDDSNDRDDGSGTASQTGKRERGWLVGIPRCLLDLQLYL